MKSMNDLRISGMQKIVSQQLHLAETFMLKGSLSAAVMFAKTAKEGIEEMLEWEKENGKK